MATFRVTSALSKCSANSVSSSRAYLTIKALWLSKTRFGSLKSCLAWVNVLSGQQNLIKIVCIEHFYGHFRSTKRRGKITIWRHNFRKIFLTRFSETSFLCDNLIWFENENLKLAINWGYNFNQISKTNNLIISDKNIW